MIKSKFVAKSVAISLSSVGLFFASTFGPLNGFNPAFAGGLYQQEVQENDAATTESPQAQASDAISARSERDEWHGGSLGIRIEERQGQIAISELHPYAAEQSTLQAGDIMLAFNGNQLTWQTRIGLLDSLKVLAPGSRQMATIVRDGQQMTIDVTVFRRQLLDIPEIVRRLKSNQIIQQHLLNNKRPDFLDTIQNRMIRAVGDSDSPRQAAEAINAIIDEIDVSHTTILPTQSFNQLLGAESADLGLTIQRHVIDGSNRYFVTDRMPGSAGYDSDLVLGDEIVSVNNVPIHESRRLILAGQEHRRGLFFLQVQPDEVVTITYRRRQNSNLSNTQLTARPAVDAEQVLSLSAKVIEDEKKRIGYVRFWNLMSANSPGLLGDLMVSKFSGCDALILDLRGRGGLIPVVIAMDGLISTIQIPVIAITDDLTRSAKEMLSARIKKHEHVTVIGQTTAGAVIGATMIRLPSGNGMMLPVLSTDILKTYTDGVVIEGVGVAPDVRVDFQIPWCAGNDRLLEAAIETAKEQNGTNSAESEPADGHSERSGADK